MHLMDRTKFLKLPAGTVFSRFYAELLSAEPDHTTIQPKAWADWCIKGQTVGEQFEYTNLHAAPGSYDKPAGPVDWKTIYTDKPLKGCLSVSENSDQPREQYMVWDLADVESLVGRLQSALAHMRTSRGLEI